MGFLSNIAKAIEGGRIDAQREREQQDRRLQETVSSIQNLNAREDAMRREAGKARMAGDSAAEAYYNKQADALSEAAFGLSGSSLKNR